MYKSNIVTLVWVYLIITLAKQRAFMGKNDMIYDRPSETVPERYFGLDVFSSSFNYKAVRHILESVYNMPLIKYHYQPLCPFLAKLGQKKHTFCVRDGGTLISIEKLVEYFFKKR